MKFCMTLLVITEGETRGEIDVLCEFNTPLDAIRAVTQLGTANSLLFSHPEVRKLFTNLPPTALARLHEHYRMGTVLIVKDVREYKLEVPEDLRRDPELLYHVIASRSRKKIPPEGLITTPDNVTVH